MFLILLLPPLPLLHSHLHVSIEWYNLNKSLLRFYRQARWRNCLHLPLLVTCCVCVCHSFGESIHHHLLLMIFQWGPSHIIEPLIPHQRSERDASLYLLGAIADGFKPISATLGVVASERDLLEHFIAITDGGCVLLPFHALALYCEHRDEPLSVTSIIKNEHLLNLFSDGHPSGEHQHAQVQHVL